MTPNLHDLAARSWVHEEKAYLLPSHGQIKLVNAILFISVISLIGFLLLAVYLIYGNP